MHGDGQRRALVIRAESLSGIQLSVQRSVFFLFGFTIILVAPGVTILPPEITRRAVLFGPIGLYTISMT